MTISSDDHVRIDLFRHNAQAIVLNWWRSGGHAVPLPPIMDPMTELIEQIVGQMEQTYQDTLAACRQDRA